MKKKVFGVLLFMENAFLILSTLISLCYWEDDWKALLITSGLTSACSAALYFPNRKNKAALTRKDCYIIISGAWVIFSIFGMLPFLLYGTVDSVADAFFETMSGFTTTGASVLNNIDEQPHGILFWRSTMQWMGGLGIMLFSIALLPSFNRNNTQLFATEATSVSLKKLRPKTQDAARGILVIYAILTLLCCLAFWAGPMNLYDAVCHAMTTVGTGGFGTHQANFAYFNSPYLEYVCCLFMFLAGVNFALYYFASVGEWKVFRVNEELHWYVILTAVLVAIFTVLLVWNPLNVESSQMPVSFEGKFRAALFHVVSIFTSCGYQGTYCDYVGWGAAFCIPTAMMMLSGACAGSSSGGVKLIRIIIAVKNSMNELRLHSHPNAVLPLKVSDRPVTVGSVERILAFFFLFLMVFLLGTFLLALSGLDIETSVGSCLTAISNNGPGYGITGPAANFAAVSDFGKWVLSGLMLVGRLELYTILLLFTSHFWELR